MGNTTAFGNIMGALAQGFGVTLLIFAITLVGAIPLGMVFTWLARCRFKTVRYIMHGVVWVIRGTPLMLQLFVVYYVPSILFENFPPVGELAAVSVAFIINYAAYFSEIFRGGLESIPAGQYEACRVLGLTKIQTFFRVVLPQVIKRVIPAMGNEIITLVKDTSLARTIGYAEVLFMGERYLSYGLIWPLFFTAIYYLLMCGVLTLVFRFAEKKLNYYKG